MRKMFGDLNWRDCNSKLWIQGQQCRCYVISLSGISVSSPFFICFFLSLVFPSLRRFLFVFTRCLLNVKWIFCIISCDVKNQTFVLPRYKRCGNCLETWTEEIMPWVPVLPDSLAAHFYKLFEDWLLETPVMFLQVKVVDWLLVLSIFKLLRGLYGLCWYLTYLKVVGFVDLVKAVFSLCILCIFGV